jgi:hypothetical protein
LKSLFFILLAVGFHFSGFLGFIFLFFKYILRGNKITSIVVIRILFSLLMVGIIITLVLDSSLLQAASIAKKITSINGTQRKLNIFGIMFILLYKVVLPALTLITQSKRDRRFTFDMVIGVFMVLNVLMFFVPQIHRISQMLDVFWVVYLTNWLVRMSHGNMDTISRTLSPLLVVSFILFHVNGQFFSSTAGHKNYTRYFPYTHALNRQIPTERSVMMSKSFSE